MITIEQLREKARAYDEAFEKAKSWYIDAQIDFKKSLENLFPELATESEDERIREDVLAFIRHEGQHIDKYKWHKWIAWVEKQGKQNSTSWSEEDEERLQSCLNILQAKGIMGVTETVNTKWLKSLKDRVHLHKQWKPSDEQMEALHDLNLNGNISYVGQAQLLIELYNDLKN